MNSTPLVSVIIPTFNRITYLEDAIKSVDHQTYRCFEILVIDDGSNEDYAKSICDKYNNCKYLYKENGGLSSARNFGIKHAKGAYIALLDDDDIWLKHKLEKQVTLLLNHKDVYLVHSAAEVIKNDGRKTGEIIGASSNKAYKRSGNVFWNALGRWVVKSPTPLIRKEAFESDLMFDENIKIGEDLDFYQRFFYRYRVLYINEPLAQYRDHEDKKRLSLMRKKYIGIENKIYKNFKNMGVNNPFVLYRIARRLLVQAERNWSRVYGENKKIISKFDRVCRPSKALKLFEKYN